MNTQMITMMIKLEKEIKMEEQLQTERKQGFVRYQEPAPRSSHNPLLAQSPTLAAEVEQRPSTAKADKGRDCSHPMRGGKALAAAGSR